MNVTLLGASTRAAAFSAMRAGLRPTCADLFGDRDLADRCKVMRVSGADYPHGLVEASRSAPPGPWAYVGGLENQPSIVEKVSADRPLWGNDAAVLRRVRNPFAVADCLARAGLPRPDVRPIDSDVPPGKSWLFKPFASAGGRGIEEYSVLSARYSVLSTQYPPLTTDPTPPAGHYLKERPCHTQWVVDRPDPAPPASHYLQERISGVPCAAVFVADGRRATLLGVTRQLVGEPALHAKPFHYCGSIGPLALGRVAEQCCEAVGTALAAEFGLMGLFGVDAILRDDEVWAVEVNPRYSASMEIVEHALQQPLFGWHRDACSAGGLPDGTRVREIAARSDRVLAKAILFAPCDVVALDFVDRLSQTVAGSGNWPLPLVADVPHFGTRIAAGQPILTVFAAQPARRPAEQAVIDAAQDLYRRLGIDQGTATPWVR
jgi:predicted ATP-grasp superfamily ATP-dependent carboligase